MEGVGIMLRTIEKRKTGGYAVVAYGNITVIMVCNTFWHAIKVWCREYKKDFEDLVFRIRFRKRIKRIKENNYDRK